MPKLFSERSDAWLRVALLTLCAAGGGAIAGPLIYVRSPYHTGQGIEVEQPVQFDQRHHVRDDGIDCRYCHDSVERSPYAGVPPTETCTGCHSQIWSGGQLLKPVRESWFTGAPIRWSRVNRLPDYVYFDHSVHVTRGIGCVSCHGRVDRMALVRQEAPLSMGWCLDCHRAPERHLRPRDQITSMTWQPGDNGARLAAEYGTRRLTHCTACHR
jgi:hypothetical protein